MFYIEHDLFVYAYKFYFYFVFKYNSHFFNNIMICYEKTVEFISFKYYFTY